MSSASDDEIDAIDAIAEAIGDLQSHARVWRSLLNDALDNAVVSPPDIDDRSYWEHEIAVFDRVVTALSRLNVHVDDQEGDA